MPISQHTFVLNTPCAFYAYGDVYQQFVQFSVFH